MKNENDIWNRFFVEPLNFLNREIIFYFKKEEAYEIAKIVAIRCTERVLNILRNNGKCEKEDVLPEAFNDIYYLRGDLIFEINEDEEL